MIKRVEVSDHDKHYLQQIDLQDGQLEKDQFDYSKVVVKKPWGYEYLIFQNDDVAVWILYIKEGSSTSLHSHPHKKTSLIVLSSEATCNTLDASHRLTESQGLVIDKGVFHSTTAAQGGSLVMEIETPINKRDLIRIKDKYGREKEGYEKVSADDPDIFNYNFISLIEPQIYYNVKKRLGNCSIVLRKFSHPDELNASEGDTLCLLKGTIIHHSSSLEVGESIALSQLRSESLTLPEDIQAILIQKNDPMIRLSDYIISFLYENHHRQVFFCPGNANVHLIDSIANNLDMKYICTQTEHAALLAAIGCAKKTQQLGICLISSGNSATNAVSAVANAYVDSVPLLIISGQADINKNRHDTQVRQLGNKEVSIVEIVKPITKYAISLTQPEAIRRELEKAIFLATSGRKGPVWIDIPIDLLGKMMNEHDLQEGMQKINEKERSISQISAITALLSSAQRPVILAGNGIRLAGAQKEFISLIEKLNIPVLTSRQGADLLTSDHPLNFGRPGAYGQRSANFIIQNADVLLCIGARLTIPQIGRNFSTFARHAKKIIVDIDEEELKKPTITADIALCLDAKEFIEFLLHDTPSILCDDWLKKCIEFREKYAKSVPTLTSQGVNPYVFVETLSHHLSGGETVVVESGHLINYTMQAFSVKKDQRILTFPGLEPPGSSIPASIGASLSSSHTICLCDDVAFLITLHELQTIRTHRLPIKMFILNSKGHSTLRNIQKEYFGGRYLGSDLYLRTGYPDIKTISEAFHLHTERIETNEELAEKIKNVLSTDGTVVCEVCIDTNQEITPRITFKVKPEGKWYAYPLEEMFPFLPQEEFRQNMFVDDEGKE